MAAVAGRHGYIEYGTTAAPKQIYRLDHWDLTANSEMLDVSSFTTDGATWRAFIPGLQSWSGSISGFADAVADSSGQKAIQTALLTPATGNILLFFSETGREHLKGAVYWTAENVSVDVADSEKVVFNFQGTGALSYATATA